MPIRNNRHRSGDKMFKRRNGKGKKQDPEFSEMSGYDDVDEQGELDDLGGPVEMPRRNGLDRIDEPDEEVLPEDDLTDDVIRPIASHRNRENPFRRKTGNIIQVGGDPELREENIAKRTKRRVKKTRLFVFAVVLLIVAGAVYYVYTHVREFQGYKVLLSSDTVYEPNAEYTEFGGNLLKYTPEGVSYIDPNGNVVWTAGADMKVPIASTRGNYAVVADKGGNAVRVFSTEGAVSDLVMPYKILDVDVASQGAFTVILESDTTNYINMYDKSGNAVYEMQTSIDKSGYPLAISISDDGQKLFTSYFFMEGIQSKNNLAAYNFGEVGQNANADRMVGGFSLDNELVTRVEFLTNNLVAAFSDSEIILYDMKEKPSERARIAYQQPQIQSVFYSSSYLGTIERSSNAEDSTDYVMRVYDLNGNESFRYSFNMMYDNIHAGEDEIIVTGGNQCMIITKKGRVKFRYSFSDVVRNMIPTSKSNEYIVTFEGKTERISLRMEDK